MNDTYQTKTGMGFSVPDQILEPDWDDVRQLAKDAAIATIKGEMATANDLYQYIAIEVMGALYGPGAVQTFLKQAMFIDELEKESDIGIWTPNP